MADVHLKDDSVGVFMGGSVAEAVTHLKRFDLMSKLKKWEPEEKLARVRISMGGSASLWDSSLEEANLASYEAYEAAYKQFFVKSSSKIIAEQELLSFKLENFTDINALWAALLAKGTEAGVSGEQLATPFLNALPNDVKIHCLGTDNPNIANFLSRAKLYVATNAQKKVVAPVTPNPDDPVVALTRDMRNLRSRFDRKDKEESKTKFAHRRQGSPNRAYSPGRYYNGPRKRPQTPFRKWDKPQSPDRRRSPSPKYRKPIKCYNCGKMGHMSRVCWHK